MMSFLLPFSLLFDLESSRSAAAGAIAADRAPAAARTNGHAARVTRATAL